MPEKALPDEEDFFEWSRRTHPGVQRDMRHAAQIPEAERCDFCDGTGNEFFRMYRKCPQCDGTGRKDNR